MAESQHPKSLRLFWSYSHVDEDLRDMLDAHLSTLKRAGRIEVWHDRKILPGANWRAEIDLELDSADVILLLVSASFLLSDFCHSVELQRAIVRHHSRTALVIPIMLRPCDVEGTAIESLQQLPEGGRPITKWGNRDEGCQNVAQGLRKAIENWGLVQANAQHAAVRNGADPPQTSAQHTVSSRAESHLSSPKSEEIELIFEPGTTVIPTYDSFELVLRTPQQVARLESRMQLGLELGVHVEIHDPTDYEKLIITDSAISRQDLVESVNLHLKRRCTKLEQSINECLAHIVKNYGAVPASALRGCIDSLARRQSLSLPDWTWIDVVREVDKEFQYFKAQVPDKYLDGIAIERGVKRPLTINHGLDLFDLGSECVTAHVIPAADYAKADKPNVFDGFSAQDWNFGEA